MAEIHAERPWLVVRAHALGITGIQWMDEELLRQKISEAEEQKPLRLNLRKESSHANN